MRFTEKLIDNALRVRHNCQDPVSAVKSYAIQVFHTLQRVRKVKLVILHKDNSDKI